MNEIVNRPPLGCIVEGRGEYYCYPVFISRIVNSQNVRVPIATADGNGSIIKNLDSLLRSIIVFHPLSIIITIDLRDVVRDGQYKDCVELMRDLSEKLNNWIEENKDVEKYQPFPEFFKIVIQIQ